MKFDNKQIDKFVMLSHLARIMAKEVLTRKNIFDKNLIHTESMNLLYDFCENMNLSDLRDWCAEDGAELVMSKFDSSMKDEEYMSQVTNYAEKLMKRGDVMLYHKGWA